MSDQRTVCFSHGKESGPWGTKITALARVAEAAGWQVESLDYQGIADPHERVAKLETWCESRHSPFVLVGSSMGGHVAAAAANAENVNPLGLFLMAPAFYMPGYEQYTPQAPDCAVAIVHGWHDEIVPWQNSARFAEPAGIRLLLVDDTHALVESLPAIEDEFGRFLAQY